MTNKQPKPPEHLSAEAKRLWRRILDDWPISDSAHLAVLRVGLEAFDRAQSCRKKIEKVGEIVFDRWKQPKPNPLLAAERDARAQFLQSIRVLGLDPREVA